jgi:ligand-binding SRPBCC domain-containing protein
VQKFVKESEFEASADEVFAFHERPDAFELLQPPWQTFEIIQPPSSLEVGTIVKLRVKVGPLWQTIVAEHVDYQPGRMFADRMVKGPFKHWLHRHMVTPLEPGRCRLTDDIEYQLPMGAAGQLFGGWFAKRSLERLFDYRHQVTREHCERSDSELSGD